jgi:hypothetical protein
MDSSCEYIEKSVLHVSARVAGYGKRFKEIQWMGLHRIHMAQE